MRRLRAVVPSESDPVTEVVHRYDELLLGRHLESTCAELARAGRDPELQYAGYPMCRVLRPRFIGHATYRRVCRAAALVARGIAQATSRLLTSPALRALWG